MESKKLKKLEIKDLPMETIESIYEKYELMFKAVYGKLFELSNSKKDSEEFKKEMLQLMNTMTISGSEILKIISSERHRQSQEK